MRGNDEAAGRGRAGIRLATSRRSRSARPRVASSTPIHSTADSRLSGTAVLDSGNTRRSSSTRAGGSGSPCRSWATSAPALAAASCERRGTPSAAARARILSASNGRTARLAASLITPSVKNRKVASVRARGPAGVLRDSRISYRADRLGHYKRHSGQLTTIRLGEERGRDCCQGVPTSVEGWPTSFEGWRGATTRSSSRSTGKAVRISSPGKVLFPERGETKLDLVNYYLAVAEPITRTIGGRPVLMQRFPHGASGSSFFQKRVPDNAPPLARDHDRQHPERHDVAGAGGRRSRAHRVGREPRVPRLPRVAVTGRRSRARRRAAHRPRPATGHRLRRSPRRGRTTCGRCSTSSASSPIRRPPGTAASTCTCGSSRNGTRSRCAGPRSRRRASSRAGIPALITDAWWKEERGERIFIDFNQNAPHKTIFGAWCVRAREGAQVSTPFDWSELDTIVADDQTIATVPARVAERRRSVGRHARRTAVDRTTARRCSQRDLDNGLTGRALAARISRRCRANRRASRPVGPRRRKTDE